MKINHTKSLKSEGGNEFKIGKAACMHDTMADIFCKLKKQRILAIMK